MCLSVCVLSQLNRAKAEARLALLSSRVTGTELWLHEAMSQAEEELERDRRLSEQRRSTDDFSVRSHTPAHIPTRSLPLALLLCAHSCCVCPQEDEFELTDLEDYSEENADIFLEPGSASGVCVYPAACRVIYSYQVLHNNKNTHSSSKACSSCVCYW